MSTDLHPSDAAAKHAIDLRLDTIDRALLGLLPRRERIELVAQIETKLHESAANSPADGTPEAAHDLPLRPEGAIDSASSAPPSYSPLSPDRRFLAHRRPRSRLAVSSGILGMVALALLAALPIMYVVVSAIMTDEILTISLFGGHIAAVLFGGLLAVAMGIAALVVLNRHNGRLVGHGWAIAGLCTGPLPVFVGGLAATFLAYELWPSVTVTPAYSTASIAPSPPVAGSPYGGLEAGGYPVPATPVAAPPASFAAPSANPGFDPSASYSAPHAPVVCPEQPPAPPTADTPPPAETTPAPAAATAVR